MVMALFFWSWALQNTVAMTDGNFDLGLVSFGIVLLTSSYVLGMVNGGNVPAKGSVGGILFRLAPTIVTVHYMGGVNDAFFGVLYRPIYGIYCTIFGLLWLLIALYAEVLLILANNISSSSSSTPSSSRSI
jgi:hypothetical protein